MERLFFTSDQHFGHKNIMKYCDRQFDSVHDMNVELTRAWNDTVGPNDWIALLGDLTMNLKKIPSILLGLNGRKVYIPGNHDSRAEGVIRAWERANGKKLVERCSPLISRTVDGQVIVMCHYAMRVWDRSHHGAIQVYGHSHGDLPPVGRQLDVGVDNAFRLLGEYRPFSLQEVLRFVPKEQVEKHHGR